MTKATSAKKLNLDDMIDENDDVSSHCNPRETSPTINQAKSEEEGSDNGSQPDGEDYDVDEEFDNDYAENYFDNGEGDDMDDLGDGGGGGGEGNEPSTLHRLIVDLKFNFQGNTSKNFPR